MNVLVGVMGYSLIVLLFYEKLFIEVEYFNISINIDFY